VNATTARATRTCTAFVRPRAVAEPAVRLVVIHHAGGSAAAYFPLNGLLPADWELFLLDLPGRGKSHAHRQLTDMAALAAWAADRVRPWADGAPLALFGHSLGAAVAYEAGRLLAAEGTPPAWIGVSGRCAPGQSVPGVLPDTDLPDDELMRRLAGLGGMHPRIHELPEFREGFLRLVRGDLQAVAGYRPDTGRPPLNVPITALSAADDHVAPPASMTGWSAQTTARYRRLTFDGAHFHFLGAGFADFGRSLVQDIRQALRQSPARGRSDRARPQ